MNSTNMPVAERAHPDNLRFDYANPRYLPHLPVDRQRMSDEWVCRDCACWLRFYDHNETTDDPDAAKLICTSCGALWAMDGAIAPDTVDGMIAYSYDLLVWIDWANRRTSALFGHQIVAYAGGTRMVAG